MKKDIEKKMKVIFSKKVIGGLSLLLIVFIVGMVTVFALNNKNEDKGEQLRDSEKVILKEAPYTLDELYEKIENNFIGTCMASDSFDNDCEKFSYAILHFYQYFNKETEFLASAENKDWYGDIIEYKYYSYDQYQQVMKDYDDFVEILDGSTDRYRSYVPFARRLLKDFAVYFE